MAERRAIKSTIWDDTWFGRLTPFEMVVWIGLFSKCADDQGRLQHDPALIRSKLFPFQDVTIKEMDTALNTFDGHLIFYEKGEPLTQIVRWWENQPMQYATPSNYPPPDGWIDRYRTNYKKLYITFNWPGQDNTQVGTLLWQGLSTLKRQSSWTTYLGTLNYIFNPNYNPNPKEDIHEDAPVLSRLDVLIGCPVGGHSDVDTADEMIKEFTEIRFRKAAAWAKEKHLVPMQTALRSMNTALRNGGFHDEQPKSNGRRQDKWEPSEVNR